MTTNERFSKFIELINGNRVAESSDLFEESFVNLVDKEGRTALHHAAISGNTTIAEKILGSSGVNIDTENQDQETALHSAACYGHISIVEMLLWKKANIEIQNELGWTALHLAARNGYKEVVDELLRCGGANIDAQDGEEGRPIHHAARHGHREVVKLLLERKRDHINLRDKNKWTSLHHAARNGHKETLDLLLDLNAEVDARNNELQTSLHIAASNDHIEAVQVLLKGRADINARAEKSLSALHLAASDGLTATVKLLLEKDADIESKNYLIQTPLHFAARNGHHKTVELLLKHRADKEAVTKDDWTPLHHAAHRGRYEAAQILLEHGANLEAATVNKWTPLHHAANMGRKETVQLFLNHKANTEAQDKDKKTALHLAVTEHNPEIVTLLLEFGANLDSIDMYGNTVEKLTETAPECYRAIEIFKQRKTCKVELKDIQTYEVIKKDVHYNAMLENKKFVDVIVEELRVEADDVFIVYQDKVLSNNFTFKEELSTLRLEYMVMKRLTGFTRLNMLGSGGQATVYSYQKMGSTDQYAMKRFHEDIPDSGHVFKGFLTEFKILQKIRHSRIVKYFDCFHQDRSLIFIQMELMEGSLYDKICDLETGLPVEDVKTFSWQVLDGLDHLHSHNIIHRDLKCMNVLMKDGNVKLADFGLAKCLSLSQMQNTRMHTYVGTFFFCAPEVKTCDYKPSADIWSFGVVVLEMAAAKLFYATMDKYATCDNTKPGLVKTLELMDGEKATAIEQIVNSCTNLDKSDRPTMADLKNHEFFTQRV